jgi:hypothetical protein
MLNSRCNCPDTKYNYTGRDEKRNTLGVGTMKFNRGQLVRGVVAGRFIVEESKIREVDNCEIVTLREIHPETFLVSSKKIKLPADCLVKDV